MKKKRSRKSIKAPTKRKPLPKPTEQLIAEKVEVKKRFIKTRRKEDFCLNCNTKFNVENNYCPNCGQENNHNRASFGTLIVDFFQNYFSFDSKFSNSLLPFFFQPGYLTLKFIDGKRASFVNPVRLYLIISLLFFFVFSMISHDLVKMSIKENNEAVESIPEDQKIRLDEVIAGDFSKITDDSIAKYNPYRYDSAKLNYSFLTSDSDTTNEFFNDKNESIYMGIRKNMKYSVQDVIDTLDTSTLSDFEISLTEKAIRLDRAELPIVVSQLLKNLPIMMMLLIPFLALIFKLFYVRRNQYYITHLIHTLHLHSFAYIIYGFAFLMAMYWFSSAGFWIVFGSVILVSTHSYISFLKVYKQGWFKTFIKFNIIGFIYSILLFWALFVEMFFSIITY